MRNAGKLVIVGLACALGLGGWMLSTGDVRTPGSEAVLAANGDSRPEVVRSRPGPASPSENPLFRIEPAETALDPRDDSVPVTISRQAALAAEQVGSMDITLPDGTRYSVRHERSETAADGNLTVIGRVDTALGTMASVLTFGEGAVFGTLPTPTGEMMKFTTRAGQAYLQPAGFLVPPGANPSIDLDYVMPQRSWESSERLSMAASMAQPGNAIVAPPKIGQLADVAAGEVTITILAVYTRNLVQLRGSRAAVETEYRNLVAVMNQAHIDSNTIARFEIAAFAETNYPANDWNQEAREDIINNTMPDGLNLRALRDQHAADLVTLIRPYVAGDLTCGISQFPSDELMSHNLDPGTGYSVSAVESCRPLVLAHEIGHSLGLMHDRDTVAGPQGATLFYGVYPFAFGHRQLGPPGFASVMAYDSESRPWLGYFSHPGTTLCSGVPCGDAALADNVRSINLIAESISRFRDPPGVLTIRDAWAQERSTTQASWQVVVSLSSPAPAGGVSFDVDVEPGTAELGVDAEVVWPDQLRGATIPQGQSSFSFNVRVFADAIREPSETLHFRLGNVQGNVTVLDDRATLTIIDDDSPVQVAGNVRFPAGHAKPASVSVHYKAVKDGVKVESSVTAPGPDFNYSLDVVEGSFLALTTSTGSLRMQDVIIEDVAGDMLDVDLRLREQVRLFGTMYADGGGAVRGVPLILWNPTGDGGGYYINWQSGSYVQAYQSGVLAGTATQLEVRRPPAPFVRQIVEVPPLAGDASMNLQLRQVPSLTIPHVSVIEGTAAEGSRTILLTASLSVPGSKTGVTFDIQRRGTADGHDATLPKTSFTIPQGRSRVEVPVVIHGDDRREGDEVLELRIVNVQGAAWNPGPGSVRILTDDDRPEGGNCSEPVAEGAMRMCQ